MKFKKIDFIIILTISLFYSFFAFLNLGNKLAPITTYSLATNNSIVFDFGEDVSVSTLNYYLGYAQNLTLAYETCSDELLEWSYPELITLGNVFSWGKYDLNQNFR